MKDWKYRLFVKFADDSYFEEDYDRIDHAHYMIRDIKENRTPTFIQLDMDYRAANGTERRTTLTRWAR